jgi:predicted nucleic acid-binding Zn ribbon protein
MAKGPAPIGDILAELLARRGFGRVQGTAEYEAAWRQAAGPLAAKFTRVGGLRRGKLELIVANSTLLQELTFQKTGLLKTLNELLPGQNIADLRFRVGPTS